MKIALVCPASLPATQFGGIMFLCVNIAKKLSNIGHDLTIYTTNLDFANNSNTFNKKLPKNEKIENFHIKRTNVWFSIFLFFVNPGMYKQMMNDNFDVIHAVGIRSFQALIAAMVSKKKNVPLIISDQGGLTTHPDIKQSSFKKRFLIKMQNPLIKYVINQATKIIVPNEYERKIFLLKAINLIKNNPNFEKIKILIMGVDFGYEQKMEEMINEYDISEKLIIIKKPKREDVISAYNQCKFLVLPSKWELSPLTPLEGFACKKTVISTTAHGIPFTISHNENCLLVPPSAPENLANAILELVQNPEKCGKLAESGFKMVSNEANLESMSNKVYSVYEKAIKLSCERLG